MSSLIGWTHTQNDPCTWVHSFVEHATEIQTYNINNSEVYN